MAVTSRVGAATRFTSGGGSPRTSGIMTPSAPRLVASVMAPKLIGSPVPSPPPPGWKKKQWGGGGGGGGWKKKPWGGGWLPHDTSRDVTYYPGLDYNYGPSVIVVEPEQAPYAPAFPPGPNLPAAEAFHPPSPAAASPTADLLSKYGPWALGAVALGVAIWAYKK